MALPVIGHGGNELYALREYVPGDDLRHVHWPTTARVDDLVIRQPENLRRGRMTVLADLRSSVHDEDTVEAVLSAAASLAMSALAAGLQVRVVTTAGFDSGHGSSAEHGPALLDGLAVAGLHRDRTGGAPYRLAGGLEPVVLLTTDLSTDGDLRSALGSRGAHGTTLVVFESASPRPTSEGGGSQRSLFGHARPATGARTSVRAVPVARGQSFAAAWTDHAKRTALA